jgi:hypothetical protein
MLDVWPNGPGVYDDECTALRESLHANAVAVIIAGGDRGDGFAVQAPGLFMLSLPNVLRNVADSIEQQMRDHLRHNGNG